MDQGRPGRVWQQDKKYKEDMEMVSQNTLIISIVTAVFASTGFWSFVQAVWTSRRKKKDVNTKMLLGLAYRNICQLCEYYISRGHLTKDEYEDLKKYLYDPYREMGGDGTCERLMREVEKLPIDGHRKEDEYE